MPSSTSFPRPEAPRRREHGGIVEAELERLGIDPADVLDLSVSVNRYGPAPGVLAAIREADVTRYPDPDATGARRALADSLGTAAERVVVGNGASELLWTLARLLLAPGERALVCEPAFSELRAAAEACGARVLEHRATPAGGFALDLEGVVRMARDGGVRLVYLCAPANPSGAATRAAAVAAAAARLPDATLVLDQSFLALSTGHAEATLPLPPNVVCVRSLTKEHAIPGVRVGYLLADPALAAALEASRPAWTVGAIAQAATIAACAATDFVATCRARLLHDRERLEARLRAAGFAPAPSETIYFVVRVGDAAVFRRRVLERHRILVRDLASFGLPGHVRVAACAEDEAERVVAAFRAEGRSAPAGPPGAER